jgi:branched-chain amino acid transport system ATP-binding protein
MIASADADPVLLEARGLDAGYDGRAIVREIDIRVRAGQVVALVGPNGAGKTTTLLTLAGDLKPLGGVVRLRGKELTSPLHVRVRQGLRLVTEERSVIMSLTVRDNIRLLHRHGVEACLELFPELKPLLDRKAGLLSGGEQQMLTLARALSGDVSVLLADELSLGLAPRVIERLLAAVRAAATTRAIGILLVEQQIHRALAMSDYAYVMHGGLIRLEGSREVMMRRLGDIERTYFAGAEVPNGDRQLDAQGGRHG